MTKFGKLIFFVLFLVLLFIVFLVLQKSPVEISDVSLGDKQDIKSELENRNLIEGNKDDLISFSILPNATLKGIVSFSGIIKGAYFFEANIQIGILDVNKKNIKGSYATAKTNWMTIGPVEFEGNIDLTDLPKGPAYFEIHNDNPSDMQENDKSILIPIVIE